MFKILRRLQLPVTLFSLLALVGCGTVNLDPAMLSGLQGMGGLPRMGGMGGFAGGGGGGGLDLRSLPGDVRSLARRPTSVSDVMSKIQTAGALIATVQRFAALSAAQRQQVESTVTRKYDGLVRNEKRSLAPRYASRKAEVRKQGQVRIAAAKQKQPASAAKIQAETEKEVAKVDLEWDKAARRSVASNYGTDFAVPVQSSDGKAVVAFASVKDSGVSVSDSSYKVDTSTASLKSSSKISHSGRTYAVLK